MIPIFFYTIALLIFTNLKRYFLIKKNTPNLTLKTYFFGAEGIWYSVDLIAVVAGVWLFYFWLDNK